MTFKEKRILVKERLIKNGCLNIDEYDKNSTHNLKFTCKNCNLIFTSSNAMMVKNLKNDNFVCQECNKNKVKIPTKALLKLGVQNVEDYTNNITKNLEVKCECGTLYNTSYLLLCKGSSVCNNCSSFENKLYKHTGISTTSFIKNIKDYKGMRVKNLIRVCQACAKEDLVTGDNLFNSIRPNLCRSCSGKVNSLDTPYSKLKDIGCLNPDEYISTHTYNLKFKCEKCSTLFTRSASNMFVRPSRLCSSCSSDKRGLQGRISNDTLLSIGCLNPDEYINNSVANLKFKCITCDTGIYTSSYGSLSSKSKKCPACRQTSSAEIEIRDFIQQYTPVEVGNRSLIAPLEVDLLIPEYNLAIEYDGIYWHSEARGRDRNYHLGKTNNLNNKGYELLHIFDTEWTQKQDIIKSIILNKIGKTPFKIGARNTIIKEVNSSIATSFLNDNHRQGATNSPINIGLFLDNELLSLMTFSKARFSKSDYELVRFCNKINTTIIGGASKLLKYFKTNFKGSIVTYADRRYSNGNLYDVLGFKQIGISKPNYWYHRRDVSQPLQSRVKYQKHKLSKLLPNFDNNLSEYLNMLNNGFDRIWDCGNIVYLKT